MQMCTQDKAGLEGIGIARYRVTRQVADGMLIARSCTARALLLAAWCWLDDIRSVLRRSGCAVNCSLEYGYFSLYVKEDRDVVV
jgi:hypothetical protein